jgi:hypothetical protein
MAWVAASRNLFGATATVRSSTPDDNFALGGNGQAVLDGLRGG